MYKKVWQKGIDIILKTPRYTIPEHEYGNSYYRFQVVITSERIKYHGTWKLFYFPYVYDRNRECCYWEPNGFSSIREAKKKTLEKFEEMIKENGGNRHEVSKL